MEYLLFSRNHDNPNQTEGQYNLFIKFNAFIDAMFENKTVHIGVRGLGALTVGNFKQLITDSILKKYGVRKSFLFCTALIRGRLWFVRSSAWWAQFQESNPIRLSSCVTLDPNQEALS